MLRVSFIAGAEFQVSHLYTEVSVPTPYQNPISYLPVMLTKSPAIGCISGSGGSLVPPLVTATVIHTALLWLLVPSVSSV